MPGIPRPGRDTAHHAGHRGLRNTARRTRHRPAAAPPHGAARLAAALGRSTALGVFLPAAYPSLRTSFAALIAAADRGADILEIGWPVRSPTFDGPVITHAYKQTLQDGIRSRDILDLIQQLTDHVTTPVVVMSYWEAAAANPRRFAQRLAAAGAAGCMIPDLPDHEAERWAAAAHQANIHAPQFVTRETATHRLNAATATASGWIYTPAAAGMPTGYQGPLDLTPLYRTTQLLRRTTTLPIVTGIGISTPALAAAVAPLVQGVIVGSAIVKLLDGPTDQAPQRIGDATAAFAAAIRATDHHTRPDHPRYLPERPGR